MAWLSSLPRTVTHSSINLARRGVTRRRALDRGANSLDRFQYVFALFDHVTLILTF